MKPRSVRLTLTCLLIALLMAVPAARLHAVAAEDDMRAGVAAYQQGDYGEALRIWLPLAEKGDANALFNVGQLYRTGRGVERDVKLAESFYREAAERGHVAAQGNLGTLYYFAFDDSPRVEEAISWWRQAARAGDARSQYMLGVLYFNGTYVDQDMVRAYGWTRLAAVAGLEEAIEAQRTMLETLSDSEIAAGKALSETLVERTVRLPATGRSEGAEAAGREPAAPGPDGRGFVIQVAALRGEELARGFAEELARRFPDLTVNGVTAFVRPVTLEDGRVMRRVQVGPFSDRSAARDACARLQGQGQDCFVAVNAE